MSCNMLSDLCIKNPKSKCQSGRSMIEMLGVLAIVGVLSAGAIAGYNMAMQKHKTNVLLDHIQNLVMTAHEVYAGDYTDIDSTKKNTPLRAQDLQNPFGQKIRVRKGGKGSDYFVIHVYDLPVESCIQVLTTSWMNDSGTVGVHDRVTDKSKDYSFPFTPDTAVSLCESGGAQLDLTFNWK